MPTITTTLGTAGAVGSTAAELLNQMETDTLAVAAFTTKPLEDLFRPYPITNAKTMQWNRFERLPVESTPTQMEEGVTPDSIGISINSVTATLEQYGKPVIFSELAQLTARHDVSREVTNRVGLHMGDTRMMLLYNVANAATNVYRVANRATDNALAVGDTLSYEECVNIYTAQSTAGTPTFPDGTYHFVAHTAQYAGLQTDPNWLALNQFRSPEDIRNGVVGRVARCQFVETNHFAFAATASTTSGNSDTIRSAFIAGPDWAGVTTLDAADRKLYVDPPGYGNDPARQRYTVTWKMTFKSTILNQSFGKKIRSSCVGAAAV